MLIPEHCTLKTVHFNTGHYLQAHLGMESYLILISQVLVGKSMWDYPPEQARLNANSWSIYELQQSWMCGTSAGVHCWIQIDLGTSHVITGIIAQGDGRHDHHTKKVVIAYSLDGLNWTNHVEPQTGNVKVCEMDCI